LSQTQNSAGGASINTEPWCETPKKGSDNTVGLGKMGQRLHRTLAELYYGHFQKLWKDNNFYQSPGPLQFVNEYDHFSRSDSTANHEESLPITLLAEYTTDKKRLKSYIQSDDTPPVSYVVYCDNNRSSTSSLNEVVVQTAASSATASPGGENPTLSSASSGVTAELIQAYRTNISINQRTRATLSKLERQRILYEPTLPNIFKIPFHVTDDDITARMTQTIETY